MLVAVGEACPVSKKVVKTLRFSPLMARSRGYWWKKSGWTCRRNCLRMRRWGSWGGGGEEEERWVEKEEAKGEERGERGGW
jgi:hypothetical protein